MGTKGGLKEPSGETVKTVNSPSGDSTGTCQQSNRNERTRAVRMGTGIYWSLLVHSEDRLCSPASPSLAGVGHFTKSLQLEQQLELPG